MDLGSSPSCVVVQTEVTPTCILTGETGAHVKPYHLLRLTARSAALRRLEYHWGIASGRLDPNVPENTISLREDLHHAFDAEAFALVPSLQTMLHISKSLQVAYGKHLSGVADLESYHTVCPAAESYEYLFVPLRWLSLSADSPDLPPPRRTSIDNPPLKDAVPYFPPYPSHTPLSFPSICSPVHPYFVLARWESISLTTYDDTFTTLLGGDYADICDELFAMDDAWARGPTPPPYDAASFLCSNADIRSEEFGDSAADDTSPSEPEPDDPPPVRGKRSHPSPSACPRPRKVVRLNADTTKRSKVSLWLSQLPTNAKDLFEPEVTRDRKLGSYAKERAKKPGKAEGWRTWTADWEEKRAKAKVTGVRRKGGKAKRVLVELGVD